MYYQQTISKEVECLGIGLHTGKKVKLKLSPAPVDSGIIFIRKDQNGSEIPAKALLVKKIELATTIGRGDLHIKTVEHLLSALYGMNIDNLLIEVDSEEIPIMDGSAAPFVFLLEEANIKKQDKPRNYLKISEPLEVSEGDKYIKIIPSEKFRITYSVHYDHPLIGEQTITIPVSKDVYKDQIAPARTFGFLYEVEFLRKVGLALGGSKDNAVVLDEAKVLNDHLRFKNEFVRHKVLDLLGDLSLCGYPIIGHVIVRKGGHSLHTKMAQLIIETKNKHQIIHYQEETNYFKATQPFA